MNRSKITRIFIAVIAMFVVLGGVVVVLYRQYRPAQAINLPVVPTYEYITSTPEAPITETSLPVLAPPVTPTVTPTALSFFIWPSFRSPQTAYRSNTPVPYNTPAPPQPIIPPSSISDLSNCRNILYPVRPGQEWNYHVKANTRSGDVSMKIVSVEGSQGTVDVVNQSRGLSGRTYIQCDRDIILNFPAMNAELLLGSALNGTMKADYVSGVLAPNEAAFVASNWALAWSSQYQVSGSGTVNYAGKTYKLKLNPSSMTMTCQTLATGDAAFETITVPAGTFRALKVICLGQGQAAGTVNGIAIVGWVSAQSTQWFAPNIGMLKLQSDYANLDFFGITIPLNVRGLNGQVELQSYIQGP